jgi:hypothetical protein
MQNMGAFIYIYKYKLMITVVLTINILQIYYIFIIYIIDHGSADDTYINDHGSVDSSNDPPRIPTCIPTCMHTDHRMSRHRFVHHPCHHNTYRPPCADKSEGLCGVCYTSDKALRGMFHCLFCEVFEVAVVELCCWCWRG